MDTVDRTKEKDKNTTTKTVSSKTKKKEFKSNQIQMLKKKTIDDRLICLVRRYTVGRDRYRSPFCRPFSEYDKLDYENLISAGFSVLKKGILFKNYN